MLKWGIAKRGSVRFPGIPLTLMSWYMVSRSTSHESGVANISIETLILKLCYQLISVIVVLAQSRHY